VKAAQILEGIRQLRVLVVGDICLDRWCRYDPATAEASRETGIPRIGVVETEVTPGAAGTVANNLIALGAHEVAVLGVIGDDGFGFELQRALRTRGISPDLGIVSPDVPTFTYTKLINRDTDTEDQPRVDFIYTRPMPAGIDDAMCSRLDRVWASYDVVLVSDQAETERGGVITPAVRDRIGELAASTPEKVVWVDSRVRGEHFRNVLLKCNDSEAEAACRRAFSGMDLARLQQQIGSRPLIVTEGRKGALILDGVETRRVETRPVEKPVDICGAGDSFSAGGALALAISRSPVDAAWFGNLVSSVTIMKKGTGTASPAELLEAERQWRV
jgi:rfaE bifunctional protein kinase chain/domain